MLQNRADFPKSTIKIKKVEDGDERHSSNTLPPFYHSNARFFSTISLKGNRGRSEFKILTAGPGLDKGEYKRNPMRVYEHICLYKD